MKPNLHESFQHMIDESLTGSLSPERERSLRAHLDACAECQQYLGAGNRAIDGLAGFSFEVDPTLNARVVASLRQRAQQAHAAQPVRPRWGLIGLAAVVLTIGGSFLDLKFGDLIASVFAIQRTHLEHGLLAFWIAPSLFVLLLFPALVASSKAGNPRQERSL
jgi:anti-sigma factor RsiW